MLKSGLLKKYVVLRRISQAIFFALFTYILWMTAYPLTSALPADLFFVTNPNVMIFTSISERMLLPGLWAALLMLVLSFVFGRFFCGWVCPLGTFTDWATAFKVSRGLPGEKVNGRIRRTKFFLLALILASALAGKQTAWILDPLVIMARFISLNLIPTITLGVDRIFILLIQGAGLTGPVYDFYRTLKSSFLGVKVAYFENALPIFLVFLSIVSAAFFIKRIWCRMLCPLGGLYGLTSKFALFARRTEGCTNCGLCVPDCRMGAIREDGGTVKGECILCMDCYYNCISCKTKFSFAPPSTKTQIENAEKKNGISRKDFLTITLASIPLLGMKDSSRNSGGQRGIVRPPAALPEEEFPDRCIRCGNCMKVCPTNVIQPVMFQKSVEKAWTPEMVFEIGYCEHQCTLCCSGSICPTWALGRLSLEEKKNTKLGLAQVDRNICIPWTSDEECLVCEEHCPIPTKAIKVDSIPIGGGIHKRPVVDPDLCVGCGICQNKCPVRPERAIKVFKS